MKVLRGVEPQSASALERLRDVLSATVVVRDETLTLVLVGLLARGHILLEDVPGVGKTLLARVLAAAVGGVFRRVQCTPDLLPADITGTNVFNPKVTEFFFRPGPIFANVVLADEINRATPRAQSSLLEAMGEGHVSVDGVTHQLPNPFLVIATQNPAEQFGTFPLPESELDRFMLRLRLGRPDEEQSREILRRHQHADAGTATSPVVDLETIRAMQSDVFDVHTSEALRSYIAQLALATRDHPKVGLPASPRATVALLRAAQAMAVLKDRDYVLPDDVKAVAPAVLSHRLQVALANPEDVVQEILAKTPIPLRA